jgi:hypothetical protein
MKTRNKQKFQDVKLFTEEDKNTKKMPKREQK